MRYENIIYTKDGNVAGITLNRPQVLNAANRAMFEEIKNAIHEAEEDVEVRVLVLTGAGRAFCAGTDLKEAATTFESSGQAGRRLLQMLPGEPAALIYEFPKITIASVNGPAVGMGCDFALACDFRIASEQATFSVPDIKRAIIPAASTYLLPRLLGIAKASEILLLGEPLSAEQARQLGLLYRLVKAEELQAETKTLSATLAKWSPAVTHFIKRAIRLGAETSLDFTMEYVRHARTVMELCEDSMEGVKAFMERREPVFTGKRLSPGWFR